MLVINIGYHFYSWQHSGLDLNGNAGRVSLPVLLNVVECS